jgi:DnaK suppressor protein
LTKTAANTPTVDKAADKPVAKPVAKVAPAKAASAAASATASAIAANPSTGTGTGTGTGTVKSAAKGKGKNKAPPPPAAPAQVPSTALSGGGNRFTDRFAPSPPSKQPDPIEARKNAYKADPKLVNAWKTKAGRDLTEAELMAMPDEVYMNDKQLDFFRATLQKQKDDLLSNAGETTEHLREDTSIVPDPADRATIEEEHALELRTRDRERKLLKKVAQSLTRLDTGEYGFCDETGEPIGIARLLARPTATLSLEAQQRREMKQKMFGD